MSNAPLPTLLTSRPQVVAATAVTPKTAPVPTVPATLGEVSVAFMDMTLRAGGLLPELVSVLSVEVEPVATQGLLSTTGRAFVTYTDCESAKDLPPTLIVKMQCEKEENRTVAVEADSYAMEALAYKRFTKEMTIGTPTCYHVACDATTGNYVFVMEDLNLRPGLYAISQFDGNGCCRTEALCVAQALANLHAQYWSWSQPLPSCLQTTNDIGIRNVVAMVTECGEAFCASAYYTRMSDLERGAIDSVMERADALCLALEKPPVTLLHHDCRADNLFWGDKQALGGLIILDWQLIGQGVGPLDLAWFMAGSFPDSGELDPVAKHLCIMKAYWHHLVAAGVDATLYPFEAAWRDYLLGLVWSAVLLVQLVKLGPPNATLLKFMQRHMDSMMELGAYRVPFERLV